MSLVSMTWPQSLRGEFAVDGKLVRLDAGPAALLTALLISATGRFCSHETLIEWMWPDPDKQPLGALHVIHSYVRDLRKLGVPINTRFGFGYEIPAEVRGGPRVRIPDYLFGLPPRWPRRRDYLFAKHRVKLRAVPDARGRSRRSRAF